jgi:hypothetical protein
MTVSPPMYGTRASGTRMACLAACLVCELLLLFLRSCLLLCPPLALCLSDPFSLPKAKGFFSLSSERRMQTRVGGLCALRGEEPARVLRACCRRVIWASIAVNISEVVIAPLYQHSKVLDVLTQGVSPPTFQAERVNYMTKNRMMWDGRPTDARSSGTFRSRAR